jgi:hypothetical protein
MNFWTALGAGISGLFGVGSSAMNAASQNQANKYNLQAQRETNQANMAINQSQLDYAQKMYQDQVAQQWKMFNTTNAYNSPAAQKQRYLDAGLNPYMMMGSQPAASASSMPAAGVPSQLPMQAARMEAFNQWNLGKGLSDAGVFANIDSTMADAAKTREETEGVAMQNEYFRRNQEADLAIKILTAEGLDEMKQLENKKMEFSEVIVNSPTIFVASMDPNAFVRIIMVSSAPTMRVSQSSYPKLFLSFGQWVICVSSIPKEAIPETIVRDMLIALHVYLKYSATSPLGLSSSTLRTTAIHRMKTLRQISQKLPTSTLLNETISLMVSCVRFLPPCF